MVFIENFKIIDCENYIYISREDRHYSGINNFLFDGQVAEKTNRNEWYKLNKAPSEILEKKPNETINKRYELKAGYQPTELMPSIITMEMYESGEYEDVMGLYSLKYDIKEGGYEQIEFKISTIYKRKDFEFVPNKYYAETDLLTQIEYPEVAHQDFPCKLTSDQMYSIIRNYVKSNINTKYAQVKSDYDFHFEVVRQIGLAEPYTTLMDTNGSLFSKRRKPKWVTQTISTKTASILNLKRKPENTDYGDNCCLAPCIVGENYADLTEKVEKYLKELMASINKNFCECPKCKGWGVVEE